MTPEYLTGLVFIVAVAIIWAASSVLVQYAYTDGNFHSPFLVTYIGVSLFTLWLLPMPTFFSNSDTSESTYQPVSLILEEDDDLSQEHQAKLSGPAVTSNDHCSVLEDDPEFLSSNNVHSWTVEEHRRTAMKIAPVWFLANWTYNASLAYTSITSSTVLASTGSIFTFLFALLMKEESFTAYKFGGVALGVMGSIITALQDGAAADEAARRLSGREIWGDILGLISAVGYGAYAVQTCVLCPKNESLYSMRMLLGFIGLYNLVLLFPVVLYVCIGDSAQLRLPVLASLVIKGLFDNVLSDYLWLRAVVLTSPTTATVGLGLTIPLAFISDISFENKTMTANQGIGALAVLAGFVLVNMGANLVSPTELHPLEDNEMMAVGENSAEFYQRQDMGIEEPSSHTNRPNIESVSG